MGNGDGWGAQIKVIAILAAGILVTYPYWKKDNGDARGLEPIRESEYVPEPRGFSHGGQNYFVVPGVEENFYFREGESGKYKEVERPEGLEIELDDDRLRSF